MVPYLMPFEENFIADVTVFTFHLMSRPSAPKDCVTGHVEKVKLLRWPYIFLVSWGLDL